jgi:hypothetical protein
MMWAWSIGAFSVAAVVNQIAIAVCWRALAATEPDLYKQWSIERSVLPMTLDRRWRCPR